MYFYKIYEVCDTLLNLLFVKYSCVIKKNNMCTAFIIYF